MPNIDIYMPTIQAMCQGKPATLVEMAKNFTFAGLNEHIVPRISRQGFSEIMELSSAACGLTEEEARFAEFQDSLPWNDDMIIEFTVAYFAD